MQPFPAQLNCALKYDLVQLAAAKPHQSANTEDLSLNNGSIPRLCGNYGNSGIYYRKV